MEHALIASPPLLMLVEAFPFPITPHIFLNGPQYVYTYAQEWGGNNSEENLKFFQLIPDK